MNDNDEWIKGVITCLHEWDYNFICIHCGITKVEEDIKNDNKR